jgi:pilus assembly protein CpaB
LKRRVLTAVVAVLLAVIGTAAVLVYVRQADNRALAGQRAVTVVVALKQIPSGTSANTALQDGLLSSQRLPASSVPADALSSITPGLGPLVTSAAVQPGQVLLRPMLVTAAQATSGVALPAGMIAVTIALCMPEAVAGDVQPGAKVEVFDTYTSGPGSAGSSALTASPECGGAHQQGSPSARTRVVLPSAQVLSVGPATTSQATSAQDPTTTANTSTGSGSSQGTVLVTLAVRPAEAPPLIRTTVAGLPYLALLQP